ncbi:MAG TPA: RNA 2',3'-cyclic phosphodiesterase [Prolixibacteraceae bacterium]|nr:RNA 2',3'-cyclic phosphodiesterase [Prolixibacteraceae bacterium]
MKRTFIAIRIKPEKRLSELISELKGVFKSEQLKWVEEPNLHLTLHFIGETTPLQVKAVTDMLRLITETKSAFMLTYKGTGYFGPRNQPRVLFVNIEKSKELEQLVKETAEGLADLGLPGNLKLFSPHLTLARVKTLQNPQLFCSMVEKYNDQYLQRAEVAEIVYYESLLQPAGPVYKPIQTFKLK